MEASFQALEAVLLDLHTSVTSHTDDIQGLVLDPGVPTSVAASELGSEHLPSAEDDISDIVFNICHDMHENMEALATVTYHALETHLEHWRHATASCRAQASSLWHFWTPGDRVVVGLQQSSPYYIPTPLPTRSDGTETGRESNGECGEYGTTVPLPHFSLSPKSGTGNDRWNENKNSSASVSSFLVADQYVTGTLLSTTTTTDTHHIQTTGISARVRLDRVGSSTNARCSSGSDGSSAKGNRIAEEITVPVASLVPYKQASQTRLMTSSTSSVASDAYQVGGIVLLACSTVPGVYEPAKVVAVNHQYSTPPAGPSSTLAATGAGATAGSKNNNNDKYTHKVHPLKEISLQYLHKNSSVRILVDNNDPLHLCPAIASVPLECHKKCSCHSVLTLDVSSEALSPSSLHSLGFLLVQVPSLLSHFTTHLVTKQHTEVDVKGAPFATFRTALHTAIHTRWQASLQKLFYFHDREQCASIDEVATGGEPERSQTCDLQNFATSMRVEVERVLNLLCPESSPLSSFSPTDKQSSSQTDTHTNTQSPDFEKNSPDNEENKQPHHCHQSHHLHQQRVSSASSNVQFISGTALSSFGTPFHIISCEDDFTYSNISVMPFTYDDIPGIPAEIFDQCNEKGGYAGLRDHVSVCRSIRYLSHLFDRMFQVGIMLLEGVHHHEYQNDFLFATSGAESKQTQQSHLSNWFDTCNSDSYDGHANPKNDSANEEEKDISTRVQIEFDETIGFHEDLCAVGEEGSNRSRGNSYDVPKLNFNKILPDEDDDMNNDNKAKTREHTDVNTILGGSSRLLKVLVSTSLLAAKHLLRKCELLPAPYEVDPHEWGTTLSSLLDTRTTLLTFITKIDLWHTALVRMYHHHAQVMALFNNTLLQVKATLMELATNLHEIIPTKIDEAVANMSQVFETVVVSSIWREDWAATSVYKKGHKVTSGVLSLVLQHRTLIHSFVCTLQSHPSVVQRLCATSTTIAIRAVLNAYSAIAPSRVRQAQVQKDLTASLASFTDVLRIMVEKDIFPAEEKVTASAHNLPSSTHTANSSGGSSGSSGACSNADSNWFLHSMHTTQRSAFVQRFNYSLALLDTSADDGVTSQHPQSKKNGTMQPLLESALATYCLCTLEEGSTSSHDKEHVSDLLSSLHIEDYGFGDVSLEFIAHLKETLLELLVFTHVNIASSSAIDTFIATLTDTSISNMSSTNQHQSSSNRHKHDHRGPLLSSTSPSSHISHHKRSRNSGGLEMFDNYYHSTSESVGYPEGLLVLKPLLSHSNVHLNTTRIAEKSAFSLATILACVVKTDSERHDISGQGMLRNLFTSFNDTYTASASVGGVDTCLDLPCFDMGRELLCCHGGTDSKSDVLFCSVDVKVLTLLSIDAPYLLSLLPTHRRELIPDTYPPLSEQEEQTKEHLQTFLGSYSSVLELHQATHTSSLASMAEIIAQFPFQEEEAGKGCKAGVRAGETICKRDDNNDSKCQDLEFFWEE